MESPAFNFSEQNPEPSSCSSVFSSVLSLHVLSTLDSICSRSLCSLSTPQWCWPTAPSHCAGVLTWRTLPTSHSCLAFQPLCVGLTPSRSSLLALLSFSLSWYLPHPIILFNLLICLFIFYYTVISIRSGSRSFSSLHKPSQTHNLTLIKHRFCSLHQ